MLTLAFLPLPLGLALMFALYLDSPTQPVTLTEPPLLFPVFGTALFFLVLCVVFCVAMRSYVLHGSPTILFLGCGVLTFGTGTLISRLISPLWLSVNMTIFTVSALASSTFHMIGIVRNVMEMNPEPDRSRRVRLLATSFGGVLAFIALVAFSAMKGIMPQFFMQGSGPTPLRQALLVLALLLFVISSSSMMIRFIERRTPFFYWYSLALASLSLCVGAALLQPITYNMMGWVRRVAQCLAGVYFLIALVSLLRGARTEGVSVDTFIADIFGRTEQRIASILNSMTDCHYELDREWRFTRINEKALLFFDKQKGDFIGRSFWDVMRVSKDSALERLFRKPVQEEIPFHFDLESRTIPGRWAEIHAYPTEEGLSVYFRDITDRKRAEEALRESEAFMNTLLDAIPIPVFYKGRDGRYRGVQQGP